MNRAEGKVRKKKVLKEDFTKPGKPFTQEGFDSMVREAEESGYLTPEEFKKNARVF